MQDASSQKPARDGPTLVLGGAGGSVAEATPGPTPNYGLTGACNMANPNAAFGMFTVAGSVAKR